MKKWKNYIVASLVGVMLFSLVGCGSSTSKETEAPTTEKATEAATEKETTAPDDGADASGINTTDPITLTMSWWGGDERHEATQKAVDAFTAKYPNITVDTTFSAWGGWEEVMGLAFSSGTAEDIVQINWNWIEAFGANGATFYDLYEFSDVLDVTQFPQNNLESSEIDGKLMGLPISVTARTMFWNQDTFDKAGIDIPTTWDELLAAGETFKTVLGDDYYPMMLTEYDRALFMVYYLQSVYGKDWVVNGELNYTAEEIAEGFAMFKELEDAHVIPTIQMIYDYAASVVDQSDRWIDGYWAGVYTWSSSYVNLAIALPKVEQMVVGPMFGGFPYKGGLNKISQEFAISSTCKHPVEAAALLNFLLNEEEGVILMSDQRGVPASKAGMEILASSGVLSEFMVETTELALGGAQFAMDSQFENAQLRSEGDGVYYTVMSNHSYGNYTNEEAAEALINGINEVLGN
jgi:ABC-type sugar transport system, periplasmic component